MIAVFDGQDYLLMLRKETEELQKLKQGKLEAQLQLAYEPDKDSGKKVTVGLAENNCSDGVELTFVREGKEGWNSIREIRIGLNNRAYANLIEHGQVGTRYNGSDKVEIINSYPDEF